MKRTYVIVAGLATLCAGLYCGANLLAQAPVQAQPQPPAQTRIACVNLHLVLKGYAKTKIYDAEVEAIVAPLRKQGEDIKEKIKQYEGGIRDAKRSLEEKDGYEKAIISYKRVLEDLERDAAKKVSKKREEQLVQLYREIEEAVTRYASTNGFTLVLQFTEPEAAEKYTAPNIQRKLAGSSQTGCTAPIYIHPGLDISAAVITNLNSQYPPAATATPTPGKQ